MPAACWMRVGKPAAGQADAAGGDKKRNFPNELRILTGPIGVPNSKSPRPLWLGQVRRRRVSGAIMVTLLNGGCSYESSF